MLTQNIQTGTDSPTQQGTIPTFRISEHDLVLAVMLYLWPVDVFEGSILVEIRAVIQVMTGHAFIASLGKRQFH